MYRDNIADGSVCETFSSSFIYKPGEKKIYLAGNPKSFLPIGSETVFELESFLSFFIEEDQKEFRHFLADNKTDSSLFATFKNKNEENSFCSVYFRILDNDEGMLSGMVANISAFLPDNYLFKDIKTLIEGLSEIRKITHDLNNQFQIIMGFASAIEDDASDPETKDNAACIVNAVDSSIEHNKTLRKYFPPKKQPDIYLPDFMHKNKKPGTNNDNQVQSNNNQKEADKKNAEQVKESTHKQAKNVLVVDDEPLVNKFLCQMLKRLKFKSEGFNCGNDALKHIKSSSNKFDLAIIDMNLPDISAELLFNEISVIDPAMKVILISGDSLNETSKKMLDQGAKGYLQKPTTVQKLSQTINEALA